MLPKFFDRRASIYFRKKVNGSGLQQIQRRPKDSLAKHFTLSPSFTKTTQLQVRKFRHFSSKNCSGNLSMGMYKLMQIYPSPFILGW